MRRPTERQHRLIEDGEIHDAALWRLAAWTPEQIEAGSARLVRALEQGQPLDSEATDVAEMLASFTRPGDRREPWTALCALAVLHADACADARLFLLAGFEVLTAYRQAMRGHQLREADDLDNLLAQYMARHPEATAAQIFKHCAGLAELRLVIEDADSETLTYRPRQDSNKVRTIRFHAFEVRVSRLRHRAIADQAPTPQQFPAWLMLQPVAVSLAG